MPWDFNSHWKALEEDKSAEEIIVRLNEFPALSSYWWDTSWARTVALQVLCLYISPSDREIHASKGWKKHGGKTLTGGLLSSQRLALPALVYSKDLEEIGCSWDQVNDFSKRASGDGQSLAVLARAVDRDHLHPIAGHLALGWGPHDGDLDVRNLHKLQISGGRHFIWKHRGTTVVRGSP